MSKPIAIFDLDGTVRHTGAALYPRASDVSIISGMPERLVALRKAGYYLIGASNQGGVAKGEIQQAEVDAAVARTQELLGEAQLDGIFYCAHDSSSDGHICDCKKPSPGMVLDALTAFPASTLDGSFVVGDSPAADGGLASNLGVPYIRDDEFRHIPIDRLLDKVPQRRSSSMTDASEDRITGCLVGMAIGDALGAPLEFHSRTEVRRMYPEPLREMRASRLWAKGEYTDDTQMALCIADSLITRDELMPSDVAARFRKWCRTTKDVGIQTRTVLAMPGYESAPETCAREYYVEHPSSSAGNGAVMRCAPIALFHLDSIPMLLADSRRSARLTHADPKAQSSCVLLNLAIREAVVNGTRDARPEALSRLPQVERKEWTRLKHIENVPEYEIASSGYTIATVEAAFWSFLTTRTFEDAVVRAAHLGDDADTVAAVTGAIAGAFYGYSGIPVRWLRELMDRSHITNVALLLAGRQAVGLQATTCVKKCRKQR